MSINIYLSNMKDTLLLLLLFVTLNCFSNDIFIYKNDKNVFGENVIDNQISPLELKENLTYRLTNNLSITTKDDQSLLYALSSKTFIKQDTNTSVYFNEFFIEFENTFELPENLVVKESSANFSIFSGQLYLIQRAENVNTTILTPLANVNFGEAKLFLKTSTEYTMLYVFEGVAYLYETKGNKMCQVPEGHAVVVIPSPKNWKLTTGSVDGHTFIDKQISELGIGDEDTINDLFSDLQYSFDNTIFINYTDRVFGIKYKKRKTNE
jgi:hypothetical protein